MIVPEAKRRFHTDQIGPGSPATVRIGLDRERATEPPAGSPRYGLGHKKAAGATKVSHPSFFTA